MSKVNIDIVSIEELQFALKFMDYPDYYPDFYNWLVRSDHVDRIHSIIYHDGCPLGFSIVDTRRNKLCTFFIKRNKANLGNLLYKHSIEQFGDGNIRCTLPSEVEYTLGNYLRVKGWVEVERRNDVYRDNSIEIYMVLYR